MAVQTPEEGFFSIEVEVVTPEFSSAEAHLVFFYIQNPADLQQRHPAGIEDGMLQIPGLDPGALDGNNAPGGKGLADELPFSL